MHINPDQNPADFPRSHALQRSLQNFADRMQTAAALTDGFLTARVVGEFSAGKTRLLRELFGALIPEALFPISSLERQTRLQLEITYGEHPGLTLIEREADYKPAQILETLAHFPERDELTGHDPLMHRLRLSVSEPRLILDKGDGYSDDPRPKRLFLIDTPGWNSGDDALAEGDAGTILTGYHNLALVYVCQASRLDGVLNADRLREFLEALADADFLDQPRLLFVLTHCPAQDAERFRKRARDLVLRLWAELDREEAELGLDVFPVEFHQMAAPALQAFRDDFWASLLAPLKQTTPVGDPWVTAIRRWPAEWDIGSRVAAAEEILTRARALLERSRQGDEFIVGMNMYRLMGLDSAEMHKKLRATWRRQLGSEFVDLDAWSPGVLPDEHPLADWWRSYWVLNFQNALQAAGNFFRQAEKAIDELTPGTEDLQAYLLAKLSHPHAEALAVLDSSFTALVKTAQALVDEPAIEKRVATLFSLSLLQARYEDYYAIHADSLAAAGATGSSPRP